MRIDKKIMRRRFYYILLCLVSVSVLFAEASAQGSKLNNVASKYLEVKEYTLNNGLHLIMNRDTTSPIVTVGVMYHVGGKNEDRNLTGFAHFVEHLVFHGTKNIAEGDFETFVREAGGYSNASTSNDRTWYYAIFPYNQLELALWMESERMLHPVVTPEGFERERQVVKEELNVRYRGGALANVENIMMDYVFDSHPYKDPLIGHIEHLNAATVEDFYNFTSKWYTPCNACLVISGQLDFNSTIELVERYFADIPSVEVKPARTSFDLAQNPTGKFEVRELEGIKEPHMVVSYRAVREREPEADVMKFVINLLTDRDGAGEFVTLEKDSLISRISVTPEFYEDAGMVWIRASYKDGVDHSTILEKIDGVVAGVVKSGFDSNRINKLKKAYNSDFLDLYFSPPTVAEFLATGYTLYGDTFRTLNTVEIVNGITNDVIKEVVKRNMDKKMRDVLIFVPKKQNSK